MVRNLSEMGENLQLIVRRLFKNQNLLKLLYYSDKDPLSQPDLDDDQIQKEVFEKLVKVVPRIGAKETAQSIVALQVNNGRLNSENNEFRDISISFEVFVPMEQWFLKNQNLRPFLIMGELQKSLDGKTINGLGKMRFYSFEINFLTEEISCYEMTFGLTTYD